jgi:hypothetical protein
VDELETIRFCHSIRKLEEQYVQYDKSHDQDHSNISPNWQNHLTIFFSLACSYDLDSGHENEKLLANHVKIFGLRVNG